MTDSDSATSSHFNLTIIAMGARLNYLRAVRLAQKTARHDIALHAGRELTAPELDALLKYGTIPEATP